MRRWVAEGGDVKAAAAWRRTRSGPLMQAHGGKPGSRLIGPARGKTLASHPRRLRLGPSPDTAAAGGPLAGRLHHGRARQRVCTYGLRLSAVRVLSTGGMDAEAADLWISAGLSPEEAVETAPSSLSLDEGLSRQGKMIEAKEQADRGPPRNQGRRGTTARGASAGRPTSRSA